MKFTDIPQFTRRARYRVDIDWRYLEDWIEHQKEIDLNPDFQRAHIWTEQQQIRYVEFILRGGHSSQEIFFNHPGWMGSFKGEMVLVDGKQRIQAARKFMQDEFPIFLGHYFSDFEDKLNITEANFSVHINDLATKAEVLQWYIDLNDGGTPHTSEEIEKVKALLQKEENKV